MASQVIFGIGIRAQQGKSSKKRKNLKMQEIMRERTARTSSFSSSFAWSNDIFYVNTSLKIMAGKKTTPKPETKPSGEAVMDSATISTIMESEGPIVSCVILETNGKTTEKTVDMTPKKREVQTLLKGSVTFLGQWYKCPEVEGVVLVVNKDLQDAGFKQQKEQAKKNARVLKKNEIIDENPHALQPPFNNMVVFGDIFLMRTTEDGTPVPFGKEEYLKFARRTDVEELEIDDSEEEGSDLSAIEEGDSDDDEEGETDSEEEEEEEEGDMFAMLMQMVVQKFIAENKREPNKKELTALQAAIEEKIGGPPGGGEEEFVEEDISSEEEDEEIDKVAFAKMLKKKVKEKKEKAISSPVKKAASKKAASPTKKPAAKKAASPVKKVAAKKAAPPAKKAPPAKETAKAGKK